MSSKIRVDPRTFKIINQPSIATPTPTTTESELSSDSDSDSLTSVNSQANTVKVIKLDDSIKYKGGRLEQPPFQKQPQPQPQPQPQKSQPEPQKSQPEPQKPQPEPQKSQPEPQKPQQEIHIDQKQDQLQKQQQKQQYNIDVGSYLKNNANSTENEPFFVNDSNIEDTNDSITEEKKSVVESDAETASDKSEKLEKQKTEEQQTQDVFDLTQNKLYQVLSALFEDSKGNNISQNMVKFCELFEKQNQTMEKILNQLVIMNSNYNKQIKIPELAQINTKPAGSINDFRKKIEEIKKEEIK
jgi:hypothetical protein